MLFSETKELTNHAVLLEPVGELDISTAPEFEATVDKQIAKKNYNMIISLEKLRFLDSTGVRVFIGAYKRVKPLGGRIGLVCSNPMLRRVLLVTQLENLFKIFDCTDGAIQAFMNRRPLLNGA